MLKVLFGMKNDEEEEVYSSKEEQKQAETNK